MKNEKISSCIASNKGSQHARHFQNKVIIKKSVSFKKISCASQLLVKRIAE